MKKRSLFVATAMLLVAVLVATGATYAWFNSNTTTSAVINLGVADAATLEISTDALKVNYELTWKTAIDTEDFGFDANTKWSDYSTNDTDILEQKFYTDKYDAEGVLSGFENSGVPVSQVVHFRSTEAGDIYFNAAATLTSSNNTNSFLRVAIVQNNDATILANDSDADTDCVNGAALSDVTGKQSLTNVSDTNKKLVTMTKGTGDYYEGSATFYFWLEGTDPNCVATVVDAINDCSFSAVFKQVVSE